MQEAIGIVLDVGPSMNQAPPGEETPLQTAITAITMILQRKVGEYNVARVRLFEHMVWDYLKIRHGFELL